MTLTEHILRGHATSWGKDGYGLFRPDRVAMQDATAQMALLQFISSGAERTAVPASIHLDHLIPACKGVGFDLPEARRENKEVYDFLRSCSERYGIDFFDAGEGIIHTEVFENYATPGQLMIGTDSHTPTAGGLGMLACGVGGGDAVDVLTGQEWELRIPKVIGIKLTGKLQGSATAKDLILYLTGLLTTKGGTNCVLEYYGPGAETISATGKASICNMGAEVGATTSIFHFDRTMADYLRSVGREEAISSAPKVEVTPEDFDRHIEIDLCSIVPCLAGPFTPDIVTPVSDFKFELEPSCCMIGSCTNSSLEDLRAIAHIAVQAKSMGLKARSLIYVSVGSTGIFDAAEKAGYMDTLREAGAIILTNACGPCIGQWHRYSSANEHERNMIVTTYNRNFRSRADGNPLTEAYIASPQTAMALAYTNDISIFEPLEEDALYPVYNRPAVVHRNAMPDTEIAIPEQSERLQLLKPFAKNEEESFSSLPVLIKVQGKCTTDHISPAGKWLKYRGHLQNIAHNFLSGAGAPYDVHDRALELGSSVVIADDNYGEGSSREHAAMEARYLGVKIVVARSFARIHETNLKKQGVLALTFADRNDYDKISLSDMLSYDFRSGLLTVEHSDGSRVEIKTENSYSERQWEWFHAGSCLNCIRQMD